MFGSGSDITQVVITASSMCTSTTKELKKQVFPVSYFPEALIRLSRWHIHT